ncbi:MAG: winged helix DNA-binding domain-containing protein [Streptosporangiaceae bacterium]
MSSEVLGLRGLNRALLDRQMLLRRTALPDAATLPDAETRAKPGIETPAERVAETRAGRVAETRAGQVIETVEHLAGLQAQAPFPPYYGLWSRLEGFRPDDLAELILDRRVVRIALMRGTIHLVSARDCLMLRPLLQPVLDRGLNVVFGPQLAGVDRVALAAAGRLLVEGTPMTFSELGARLSETWPDHPPAALAQAVRALVPLVQVPPRAVWGAAGRAAHTSAESWLGRPLDRDPPLEPVVIRYLAAFGPATVRDIYAWCHLPGLREAADRLRPSLRTYHDEHGNELIDLPDAPRPDPDQPAPVRLVAEFDNLLLSHADRTRVISEQNRRRLYTRNGIFPGTVLVDGFVLGIWRITRSRGAATLTFEMFESISKRNRDAVAREGERLLAFAAAASPVRDIRFEPIT